MLHSLKERKRTERSERKRTRCPTLLKGPLPYFPGSNVRMRIAWQLIECLGCISTIVYISLKRLYRPDHEWHTGSLHAGVFAQLGNVRIQSAISIHLSWRSAWSWRSSALVLHTWCRWRFISKINERVFDSVLKTIQKHNANINDRDYWFRGYFCSQWWRYFPLRF